MHYVVESHQKEFEHFKMGLRFIQSLEPYNQCLRNRARGLDLGSSHGSTQLEAGTEHQEIDAQEAGPRQ